MQLAAKQLVDIDIDCVADSRMELTGQTTLQSENQFDSAPKLCRSKSTPPPLPRRLYSQDELDQLFMELFKDGTTLGQDFTTSPPDSYVDLVSSKSDFVRPRAPLSGINPLSMERIYESITNLNINANISANMSEKRADTDTMQRRCMLISSNGQYGCESAVCSDEDSDDDYDTIRKKPYSTLVTSPRHSEPSAKATIRSRKFASLTNRSRFFPIRVITVLIS
jgi:hypothetical protein